MSHVETGATPASDTPLTPGAALPATPSVVDVAVYLVMRAESDGWEIFISKVHFMCVHAMGWLAALSGEQLFNEKIYAGKDGYVIDEITEFFSPLGIDPDQPFTLADCVAAGIINHTPDGAR